MTKLLRTSLLPAILMLAGCGLPPAVVTNDVGQGAAAACTLGAVLSKILDPTGSENQVLAVVCPDIIPAVNIASAAVQGGLAGKPSQCSTWAPLDDSKRWGGDGKGRPGQVVCANLKAATEAELAKPPARSRK